MSVPIIGGEPKAAPGSQINKTGIATQKMPKVKMFVPFIFYWEWVGTDGGKYMTCAFQYEKHNFGETWPMTDNPKDNMKNKKDLTSIVMDTLNVIIHHGSKILDRQGNIDAALVNDMESRQWGYDPLWAAKQQAFAKAVKIKEITNEQAKKIGLI